MPLRGVVVAHPDVGILSRGDGAPSTQRVANRPIVCHVIEALRGARIADLAVVALPEVLPEIRASIVDDGAADSDITYLEHNERPGLAGALACAAPFVGGAPCLVHSACGMVGQPLAPFVELFAHEQPDLMLLLHRSDDPPEPLGPRMQRAIGVSELEGAQTSLGLAGVCLLGPGLLQRECLAAGDDDASLEMTSLLERIATCGSRVEAAFVQSWHRYDGRPLELLELNRIVLDQQPADRDRFAGADNRIEGRVVIHPTAQVSSSVILGPSIIGPHARISNAYIGPYTAVGADAVIEGAEVERSIILDGARIMHVGGRIEASTVGRRASIFRDFGLPRAMRLHVGTGVEVALN